MKLLAIILAVVAVAFLARRVTAIDSTGRVFLRVRPARDVGAGIQDAELWQRTDATGPDQPYYLRLLTPEGQPPMFTQSQ